MADAEQKPITETHASRKLAEAWEENRRLCQEGGTIALDTPEGKALARAQAASFRKIAKWIDRLVEEVEIAERNAKRLGLVK